jgi:transcriptional regulator with XRE-family HTH domain
MTLLTKNLKTTRKKLSLTQFALAKLLGIGFRTYVRYETAKRDAPLPVLVKIAKLGNITLDRLLTTTLTLENLEIVDSETAPSKAGKIEVIGGGLKEGKVMFIGLKNFKLITINKAEKDLLLAYREFNNSKKKQCLANMKLRLNTSKKT